MKKFFILLVLGFIPASSTMAQDIDKLPFVTVTGKAEVKVVPDEAIFSLAITDLDMDLQKAKRTNDEKIGRVLELTRKFGVAPQNVKTDYISVEMKFVSIRDPKTKIYDDDGDEIGKRVFKGYQVSKTVIVRLTDIARFEEFFSEVLKTGISAVNSVKFETSKLRENKDIARDMAMKAAKEKATALAASVGQTIGKAFKITEGTEGYQSNNNFANNSVGLTSSITESVATFAPGAIEVSAIVTVTFQLN